MSVCYVKLPGTHIASPPDSWSLSTTSVPLANHPLANVASSKHAEVVLMRRFKVIPEAAYKEKLDDGHSKKAWALKTPAGASCPAVGITA